MAWEFDSKPVATVKAKTASGAFITMPGVTTASITPENAAAQINKILAIGGKSILVNEHMTRTQAEGAVNNE